MVAALDFECLLQEVKSAKHAILWRNRICFDLRMLGKDLSCHRSLKIEGHSCIACTTDEALRYAEKLVSQDKIEMKTFVAC